MMPLDAETVGTLAHLGAGGLLLVAISLFLGFFLYVLKRVGKHLDKLSTAIERNTEATSRLRETVLTTIPRRG